MADTKAVAVVGSPWTQAQIDLMTRTVAKGASKDEFALFLNIAKKTGLDVWTKQMYFIKRKVWNNEKKAYDEIGTIQTGIDGYRVIAERSGQLAGNEDAIFDNETASHPEKATVTVHKMIAGQKCAFTASARWSEYAPINPKTNEIMGQWKKMPYLMLAKCAEALALRKAFPNDLSGLYTEEEMDQAAVEGTVIETVKEETKTAKKAEMAELMNGEEPETPTKKVEVVAPINECPVCHVAFMDGDQEMGNVKAIANIGMCNGCASK